MLSCVGLQYDMGLILRKSDSVHQEQQTCRPACAFTQPDQHYAIHYLESIEQGSHRLEKYLNLEGFLEKSLKIKYALKSTVKSLKCLEKSLNSSIFCRT